MHCILLEQVFKSSLPKLGSYSVLTGHQILICLNKRKKYESQMTPHFQLIRTLNLSTTGSDQPNFPALLEIWRLMTKIFGGVIPGALALPGHTGFLQFCSGGRMVYSQCVFIPPFYFCLSTTAKYDKFLKLRRNKRCCHPSDGLR